MKTYKITVNYNLYYGRKIMVKKDYSKEFKGTHKEVMNHANDLIKKGLLIYNSLNIPLDNKVTSVKITFESGKSFVVYA